jgi:hypothetical protein
LLSEKEKEKEKRQPHGSQTSRMDLGKGMFLAQDLFDLLQMIAIVPRHVPDE